MVDPDDTLFESVLEKTVDTLRIEARENPKLYETLTGSKLEGKVYEILCRQVQGTAFEGMVELISGQRFPDIVVGGYYGVEVKTTKSEHWKSTGSSVAEGTRVEGVERIYMLFGKMHTPVDFRFKRYEDCLAEVVVTHSPRYAIDMDLPLGGTFFDKLGMTYDELRKQENPIRTVLDYYRSRLKPGEQVWWLDNEQASGTSIVIRMLNTLPALEQELYKVKGFGFFPEILGQSPSKFQRFTMWLATHEGVVCHNIRDKYTSAGRECIHFDGVTYREVPKMLVTLHKCFSRVRKLIEDTPAEELSVLWGHSVTEEGKWAYWQQVALRYCQTLNSGDLPLRKFLGMNEI